jgi:hypothetical protein
MKKLILNVLLLLFLNISFGQTDSKILSFVEQKSDKFNKVSKITRCENLDSLIKIFHKKKVSYSYETFIFESAADLNRSIMGSGKTWIGRKRNPFIFYTTFPDAGYFVIEILSGTDCL